jgi:probable phosphoglycerate mutase
MTRIFLVRHGVNDLLGLAIAGRKPGVTLNAEGRAQAERLARRFERDTISKVQSSPLQRARETAEPIAERLGLGVEIAPALNEIDFGVWTGLGLRELAQRTDWQHWNAVRSSSRAPGGESMLEVQARVVGHIEALGGADEACVLVGHGDPIRSALLYYLGVAIDLIQRVEISPASISALEVGRQVPRVLFINETLPN